MKITLAKGGTLERLCRRDGFDLTVTEGGLVYPRCSQCEACVINGVACHETGCSNDHRQRLDPATGDVMEEPALGSVETATLRSMLNRCNVGELVPVDLDFLRAMLAISERVDVLMKERSR